MTSVPPIAAHWIDGRPVEGGHAFDVAAAGGTGPALVRYPRAGPQEVARALEAAERGGARWSARPRAERLARLAHAAELLGAARDEGSASSWSALGARIGLDERELDVVCDEALAAVQDVAGAGDDGGDGDVRDALGLEVVVPHWSELVCGVARRTFTALARGAPVVLVSDPRAPMAAELVARALVDVELDAGAFALLHDDVDRVVREIAVDPRGARFVVSAPTAELARRFRPPPAGEGPPARQAALASEPARAPGSPAAFGAGLSLRTPRRSGPSQATGPRWRPAVLVAGTLVVADDEDLEQAAERVVRAALSRLPALSGQRPGQVGRVLVPERRLSRFTEVLLECLEKDSDLARPLQAIDREETRERRRARALGLDEGAALIWSGAPRTADRDAGTTAVDGLEASSDGDGHERDDTRASSHVTGGRASLLASVFTNVEPGGRLFDLARPLPLLRLVRVEDEASGRRLARQLCEDRTRPMLTDPSSAQP